MAKKKKTVIELMKELVISPDEQLYKVPENWIWVKLGSLTSVISKGTTPKGGKSAYIDEGVGFLRVENIDKDGSINLDNIKHIDESTHTGYLKRSILEEGDVLVSIAGTLARTAIVEKEYLPLNTNQALAFVRMITELKDSNYFVEKVLSSPDMQHKLLEQTKVTSIPNLTLEIIKNCPIPFPPIPEQERIVNRIESLFDKIDKAQELIKEARDGFEKRKEAILAKAFRGELTAEWREESDQNRDVESLVTETIKRIKEEYLISINNAKIKKLKKPSKPGILNYTIENDMTVDEILPSNWRSVKVGLICDSIVPGRDKPKSFTGNIPWITIPDIKSETVDSSTGELGLTLKEISKVKAKIIPINSVVMTCVGRFGISAVVGSEIVINQQLHAFLPSKLLAPKYLKYHIEYLRNHLGQIASATTVAYLNKTKCNGIPINLPPIEEQNEIVRILENVLKEDKQSFDLIEMDNQIELLKKSILAKAFRGELGTNNPDDESSLEMLRQILKDK